MRFANAVLALIVAASLAAPTGAQDRKPPVFGASAELVNVVITVTDKKGKPVADLTRENFLILEDHVAQDIVLFEPYAPNVDLIVMIDASGSMGNVQAASGKKLLDTAKDGAKKFVRSLRPGDRALVVDFASIARRHVNPGDPFTADQTLLETAIDNIEVRYRLERVENPRTGEIIEQKAYEPTSLYTSLYIVLKEIVDKRPQLDPEHPRRAVIVMLTDGEDTTSKISAEQVAAQARTSGTPIYTIMIPISATLTGDDWQRSHDAEYFLGTLAKESGGSVQKLTLITDLNLKYRNIARELQTQYRVGYQPKNTKLDGGWRSIQVSVSGGANLTARTRQGYFAATAPTAKAP